jgi:hypothetical protein
VTASIFFSFARESVFKLEVFMSLAVRGYPKFVLGFQRFLVAHREA